ncbi:MAG: hypothetical protein H6Q10_2722 [Acidobacteria bacterium]|nr:hypothetical protein [Acidobacteriota bacterium]
MKRGDTDTGGARLGDERLEALVDEALREAANPPAVDLKARVMAAWDERRRPAPTPRLLAFPLLRPAAALASVLVIVTAALLLWPRGNVPSGERTASREIPSPAAGGQAPGTPAVPAQARQETAARPGLEPGRSEAAAPAVRSAAHRARRPTVVVEFPVEELIASNGAAHLPGAPAGELGDPIGALPGPPALAVQPVVTPPMLSETTRPVTDFPAEDQPPGQATSPPGQAQGERR